MPAPPFPIFRAKATLLVKKQSFYVTRKLGNAFNAKETTTVKMERRALRVSVVGKRVVAPTTTVQIQTPVKLATPNEAAVLLA
jgi:hypothetical protein